MDEGVCVHALVSVVEVIIQLDQYWRSGTPRKSANSKVKLYHIP